MKKLFLLLLLSIVFSISSFAQIHICEEVPILEDDTASRGMLYKSKLWDNGKTLKVKFKDGSSYLRRRVMNIAKVWSTYANIKFEQTWSNDCDIRVSFKAGPGSWSFVGTDCRKMANLGKVTMNYGWLTDNSTDAELRRVVLHEFGHALGLTHEHMNPLKTFTWNEPAVKKYYIMRGWSLAKIERNMLKKYTKELTNGEYDRYSIMHYAVPKAFTKEGVEIKWNHDLSWKDKKLIRELYPDDFTVRNKTNKRSKFKPLVLSSCNIEEVNATVNNKGGLLETVSFKVKFNAKGAQYKNGKVRIDFYDQYGQPLKTDNKYFKNTKGQLSVWRSFYISKKENYYGQATMSLPTSIISSSVREVGLMYKVRLYLNDAEYCYTKMFPIKLKEKKGLTSITAGTNGSKSAHDKTEIKNLKLKTEFDPVNKRFKMIPQFIAKGGKGKYLKACVYFYDSNKKILRKADGGMQSWCKTFTPSLSTTFYSTGSLLTVHVPYNEINMPMGKHALKYFVAIWEDGKQIATSKWHSISMTRN